ncbi:hypothetical protein [Sodalis sp. dw_96]|uniref:hypothetical protein n=1 Tax=Sodalis sp. dw_96 TaxID=2719794 RepID=UPI001BD4D086|nr:hypothetical protein [Sodalis sp. dw_96]
MKNTSGSTATGRLWQRIRDKMIFPAQPDPAMDIARRLAAFLPLGCLYGVEIEMAPLESARHERE